MNKKLDSVPWYGVHTSNMKKTDTELMTIGTLAKAAGVGVETVRFYQRKGLLEMPLRTSGFRKYSESDVRKIKFVKEFRSLASLSKTLKISWTLLFVPEKHDPLLQRRVTRRSIKLNRR